MSEGEALPGAFIFGSDGVLRQQLETRVFRWIIFLRKSLGSFCQKTNKGVKRWELFPGTFTNFGQLTKIWGKNEKMKALTKCYKKNGTFCEWLSKIGGALLKESHWVKVGRNRSQWVRASCYGHASSSLFLRLPPPPPTRGSLYIRLYWTPAASSKQPRQRGSCFWLATDVPVWHEKVSYGTFTCNEPIIV